MAPFAATLELPSAAFDAFAETYDDVFTDSRIGRAQRASVWREMDRLFKPGQRVLEINCGTGVDALHLAERGVRVVACDASRKMVAAFRKRITDAGFNKWVELHTLCTEELRQIEGRELFDGALSNFAGLNCVEDLPSTAKELARLLRPGAALLICIFGRWCAWEIGWYLAHGNRRKAFRRRARHGTNAQVSGVELRVYYPAVRELIRAFAPYFCVKAQKGVGVLVPTSYLEPLAIRFPRAFRCASYLDRALGRIPVARSFADHRLLTLERLGD